MSQTDYLQKYYQNPAVKGKKKKGKAKGKNEARNGIKIFTEEDVLQKIEEVQDFNYQSDDEDNAPLFVETQESMLQNKDEKEQFLENMYKKNDNKKQQNKMQWTTIQDSQEATKNTQNINQKIESESKSASGSSSPQKQEYLKKDGLIKNDSSVGSNSENRSKSSDSDNSDSESVLGKRRVRHDSSDSDISVDEADKQEKLENRETVFKKKIINALGMNEKNKKEDSDIDVNDSADDDENLQRLQEAKKREMLDNIAKEYENVEQIIRDKDGKKISIKETLVYKAKELEEQNIRNLRKWKGGYKQYSERIEMAAELEFAKEQNMKDPTNAWGSDRHRQNIFDSEKAAETRFEDPLKRQLAKEKMHKLDNKGHFTKLTLECRFPYAPNRYKIKPGYMWDGQDRSNAYERKLLERMNEAAAMKNQEWLDHQADL